MTFRYCIRHLQIFKVGEKLHNGSTNPEWIYIASNFYYDLSDKSWFQIRGGDMSLASSVVDTHDILQFSNSGDFFQLRASHLSPEDPTSAPGATRQYISVSRLVLFTCLCVQPWLQNGKWSFAYPFWHIIKSINAWPHQLHWFFVNMHDRFCLESCFIQLPDFFFGVRTAQ